MGRNTTHNTLINQHRVKTHSHRACLRPSTDVDARLRRYGTHGKRPARSHQARVRPSMDVDALKIDPAWFWARLRPSTDVDALGVWRAGLFPCVPFRHRCASTSRLRPSTRVEGRTRASTSVDARSATDVDTLGVNGPSHIAICFNSEAHNTLDSVSVRSAILH